jgi:hypothetical protein
MRRRPADRRLMVGQDWPVLIHPSTQVAGAGADDHVGLPAPPVREGAGVARPGHRLDLRKPRRHLAEACPAGGAGRRALTHRSRPAPGRPFLRRVARSVRGDRPDPAPGRRRDAMPDVANDGTSATGVPDQSQHHLGARMVTVAV